MAYSRYFVWLSTLFIAIALWSFSLTGALVFLVLFLVGVKDIFQKHHAILRNYPLIGHIRYLLEYVRPEIRQYFIESDEEKLPFSRNQRAMVYARSKLQNDKRGFGTIVALYEPGSQWLCHSNLPQHPQPESFRIFIGGPECTQPYSSSIFNISAMSFGALSPNAIRALNRGASLGRFAHDTGEGSISAYHREFGGDIIWELGSGYFGSRTPEGRFCDDKFVQQVRDPQIKMVEIKLSQGAKPGHGGVLPAAKVSAEIALTRGIPMGQDCVSPASHPEFSTPRELMAFIVRLRHLSQGKPVGFKLCVGQPWEWFAIVKAMLDTGVYPDFIVVDGKEGGTGAAPVEFTDYVGMPLQEGLRLVHNTLVGIGQRDRIRIGASGKIISAFDIVKTLALGADWCNSARGFMFALGCIQSRACHTDFCPTGVATQDLQRQKALVVPDKAQRVKNFHEQTLVCLGELIGAAGLVHPQEVTADYLMVRDNQGKAVSLTSTLVSLKKGELLSKNLGSSLAEPFQSYWHRSSPDSFRLTEESLG